MKKGDAIATVAQPIARTIDYFFGTDIQHCSGCKKMQYNLNAGMNLADAIYERFWPKPTKENTMQFVMQVIVEADTLKQALEKLNEGEIISVNPRPPQAGQVRAPLPGTPGTPGTPQRNP